MAKKAKVSPAPKRPEVRLCEGVTCTPEKSEWGGYKPLRVVLRCSVHGGVDVFGPFVDEKSAHEFIRTEADGENYERYGTAHVPGVYWTVDYLQIPTTTRYE